MPSLALRRFRAGAATWCRRRRCGPPAARAALSAAAVASRHHAPFGMHPMRVRIVGLDRQERAGPDMQRHRGEGRRLALRSPRTSSGVKCRPAVGAATAPSWRANIGLIVGAVAARRSRACRRYRAAAACAPRSRSPHRARRRMRRRREGSRRPRPCARPRTSAVEAGSACLVAEDDRIAGVEFLGRPGKGAPAMIAVALDAAVTSIFASAAPRLRRPISRAGMTRVSLTTRRSPGRSRPGRSRIDAIVERSAVPAGRRQACGRNRAARRDAAQCAPAAVQNRRDRRA